MASVTILCLAIQVSLLLTVHAHSRQLLQGEKSFWGLKIVRDPTGTQIKF